MAIYLKTSPVGIDKQIQRIQQYLYDKIVEQWSCDVDAYGRAYVDTDGDSVKPKAYLENGEYRELLTDDTRGVHFFFIEKNAEVLAHTCHSTSDVDLIFIVDDLTQVKSGVGHYADEEIKEDVKSWVKQFWLMETITKGEDALDGFDTSKLHFRYPYHVFKISGTINNY